MIRSNRDMCSGYRLLLGPVPHRVAAKSRNDAARATARWCASLGVRGVALFLELDEAELLARKLLDIAIAAKHGVYSSFNDG